MLHRVQTPAKQNNITITSRFLKLSQVVISKSVGNEGIAMENFKKKYKVDYMM